MLSLFKSLFLVAVLTLLPYPGGAVGGVDRSAVRAQPVQPQATEAAASGAAVNPWALAGLLLSVMVLGAVRRR